MIASQLEHRPARVEAERVTRHVLADGSVVRLDGCGVAVLDAHDRLLIAYRDGHATVAAPRGDLRLAAPEGAVRIEAADDVRVSAGGAATIAAGRSLSLDVGSGEAALELGRATVRMSAERVDCQASRELALRAPSVQILAQRLVQVVDALATRAGRYELAARTVVERSEETVREVRGLLSTTAARLRLTAHEIFEARSDRTVLRSDKETSIEAERILLG